MKAMVLAAGRGERLRPLTDTTPKPLLEAGGKALIEHQLDALAVLGVKEVVINIHHLGEQIRRRVGDGERFGMQIQYSVEDRLLETGGGIKHALGLLGSDPFIVISADTYQDFDLLRLPDSLPKGSKGCLVMVENPSHHPGGDFAVGDDGLLSHEGNKYTYSGLGILHPSLVADVSEDVFALRKVFDPAIAAGTMSAIVHHGYWCDVGTADRYRGLRDLIG